MNAHIATVDTNKKTLIVKLSRDMVVAFLSNPSNNPTGEEVAALFKQLCSSISEMLTEGAQGDDKPAPERNSSSSINSRPVISDIYDKFPHIKRTPLVSEKDSITNDHLICMIDGKRLKMIKRHLRAKYGMSFQEYREFFDLGSDYPSVAPGYANEKSAVAKAQGLGSTITKTPRSERTSTRRR